MYSVTLLQPEGKPKALYFWGWKNAWQRICDQWVKSMSNIHFFLLSIYRKAKSAAEPRSLANQWNSPTLVAQASRSTGQSTVVPVWIAAAAPLTTPEPSVSSSAARMARPSTRTSWWSSPASALTTVPMPMKPPTPSTVSQTTSTSSETEHNWWRTPLTNESRGVNRLMIDYQLLVVTRFPRNCGLTSWGLNEVHCLLWLHQHSYYELLHINGA